MVIAEEAKQVNGKVSSGALRQKEDLRHKNTYKNIEIQEARNRGMASGKWESQMQIKPRMQRDTHLKFKYFNLKQ